MELKHVVIAFLLLEYFIEDILPSVGFNDNEIANITKAVMILVVRFLFFYVCKELFHIIIQVLNEHERLKNEVRKYRRKRKRRKKK